MTPNKESGKSSLENLKVTKTFQGWLRTIAKNRCIQLYKKKKIKPIPVGDEVPNGPLANLAGSNDIDMSRINKSDLKKVLCRVKPLRFRQIIELVHLQGMSNEEAAKALNMNRDNFNTKHCLARIKVKSILKEEGIL
jgi:RNA polymerase sigma factor (sigma-70 family)